MRLGARDFLLLGTLALAGCECAAPRHEPVAAKRPVCQSARAGANLLFAGGSDLVDLGEQMASRTSWPSVDRGYVIEDELTASIYSSDGQFVPEIGFNAGFYPDASAYTAWGPFYGNGNGHGNGLGRFPGNSGLGGYGPWGYPGSYYGYGYPSQPYAPYGSPGYLPPGYQRQSDATRTITIRR